MISTLGGPADLLQSYTKVLPTATVVRPVHPAKPGIVQATDMRAIGLSVVSLGGGRRRAADAINPAVGLSDLAQPGEWVDDEKPLAVIHASSGSSADQAEREILAAVTIGDQGNASQPLVSHLITA
jgi:thymidine phosphorylase